MSNKEIILGKPITIHTEPKRNPKKILAIAFVILLLTTLVIESAFAFYAYKNPEILQLYQEKLVYYSNKSNADIENAKIMKIEKQPKKIEELFVTGWIPDWDMKDGFATVQQRPDLFKGISPVWFYVNEDGSLKGTFYTNNADYIKYCKDNKIDLVPTISLFDADILHKVLNNPESYTKHISEIVKNVTEKNYDGIDLDYESTILEDKKFFFEFLKDLSKELKNLNKKLVFTVMPKWGDEIYYQTLPQTRRVQDYKRIGELADEFRIMTYDYTGRATKEIGPIAPLSWMELVIKYAIYSGVPREKIVLGVNTYAYDWSERPITSKLEYVNYNPFDILTGGGLEEGDAYYFKAVRGVEKNYSMKYKFNNEWGEAVGEYTFENKKRIVVFPIDKSIELRKQLAADYGLKGISYWRVGDEADLKL